MTPLKQLLTSIPRNGSWKNVSRENSFSFNLFLFLIINNIFFVYISIIHDFQLCHVLVTIHRSVLFFVLSWNWWFPTMVREYRIREYLEWLKRTWQLGLRSFYKPCSKKFGLDIQRCENTSGHDTLDTSQAMLGVRV